MTHNVLWGGVKASHPFATIIHAKYIGRNFSFRQLTTIGNKYDGQNDKLPIIGDNVTLGSNVVIIGEVHIGNNVFVGYGTVILPDTYIGDNVIIGAGSIVRGKVDSDSVVVGNPAKRVCSYFEYIDKNRKLLEEGYICENGITPEVIALMEEKRVFVE